MADNPKAIIYYEIGKGNGDRPAVLGFCRQIPKSGEDYRDLLNRQVLAQRLPGSDPRPTRIPYPFGDDPQDMSIVIEQGDNVYVVRHISDPHSPFFGRAKFGPVIPPLTLTGVSPDISARILTEQKLLAPDLSGASVLEIDTATMPNDIKNIPDNSWAVFRTNPELCRDVLVGIYGGHIPDNFRIPFAYNLYDSQYNVPVWVLDTHHHDHPDHDHDETGSSPMNKAIATHGGYHPPDKASLGMLTHGGYHPPGILGGFGSGIGIVTHGGYHPPGLAHYLAVAVV
jgi:hypothetical protein